MIALNDRALIQISGDDAESFLQNLITTDMEKVAQGGCHAGALLTPQGKIQFEFLISGGDGTFLIETGVTNIDSLIKRFTLYRLRLPIQIEKLADLSVYATQDAEQNLRDHRFQSDIYRAYGEKIDSNADDTWLKQAMIAEGVAHIDVDFQLNDVFPHDINFDQIGGMSFSKGCYVGQEVISRMRHKDGVRKRLMVVTSDHGFADNEETALMINGKSIGTIGSKMGNKALAICRIDKASKALDAETPIMCGDQTVTLAKPSGASFTYPLQSDA